MVRQFFRRVFLDAKFLLWKLCGLSLRTRVENRTMWKIFSDAKFIECELCGLSLRTRVINSTMWKIVFGSQKLAQATIPNPLRFANAQHLPLKHQGEARTAEDGNPLFIPNKKSTYQGAF